MRKAYIAIDGGGSNTRVLLADGETEKELYFEKIDYGTNLSTVADKKQALNKLKKLIAEAYMHMPDDYVLAGVGLSSAGTEIQENKIALEQALIDVTEKLKEISPKVKNYPPELFVTNDVDILLHSSDIALVAGTGTVGAVKYKDIKPYDNTDVIPEDTKQATWYQIIQKT